MHSPPGPHETPLERRYLAFFAEVGSIFGEALPYDDTLRRICEAAVRTVADTATMYLFDDNDELQVVAAAHVVPERSERLRHRTLALMNDPHGPRAWFEAAVRRGKSLLVPQIDVDSIKFAGGSSQYVQFILDTGVRSFIIVPLIAQEEVLGAIALVYTDYSNLQYDADALELAEDLGKRCGAAIGTAKLHQTAKDVSTRFQLAALPKILPIVPGFELDSLYEPASSEMLVGGDWFDAFECPGGRFGISIGDISGHGVDAAAFMGNLRNALRIAMFMEPDLLKVLEAADVLIKQEMEKDIFATACIAVVDTQRRTLSCVAAGHPGPLCWNERERVVVDPFTQRGLPLGFRELKPSNQKTQTIDLEPGSFVVFFTDGLLEAEHDYLGGQERLVQALASQSVRNAGHPALEIRSFVTPERHPDDLAVLTLRCS
ncbi:MAG TPA: GAF domain-containing SpoIIE family protein phosphatase [Candidatus Baltobacteraceae bacterium]|jgi:serine phosphatase RsbU (regulator of sigma subunit)|nr:GAF domain-containing SpoIIE family protein phosphatase [Candidatus Baltobacteraceae bacterium]